MTFRSICLSFVIAILMFAIVSVATASPPTSEDQVAITVNSDQTAPVTTETAKPSYTVIDGKAAGDKANFKNTIFETSTNGVKPEIVFRT